MKIYEINSLYTAVFNKYEDWEEDRYGDDLENTLSRINDDPKIKILNVAAKVKNLEFIESSMQEYELRMSKRRKSISNKIDRLRKYLSQEMRNIGLMKAENSEISMYVRANPTQPLIEDETKIPKEYFKEKIIYSVDSKKLKDDLQEGIYIEGVKLNQTYSVVIG